MIRAVTRNFMIAALVVAILLQFDSPIRSVLLEVGERLIDFVSGSTLGYGR